MQTDCYSRTPSICLQVVWIWYDLAQDILMATMLNGAAVMDAALLVIAGRESIYRCWTVKTLPWAHGASSVRYSRQCWCLFCVQCWAYGLISLSAMWSCHVSSLTRKRDMPTASDFWALSCSRASVASILWGCTVVLEAFIDWWIYMVPRLRLSWTPTWLSATDIDHCRRSCAWSTLSSYRTRQETLLGSCSNKRLNSKTTEFPCFSLERLDLWLVCEQCADCTAGRVDQTSGGTVAIWRDQEICGGHCSGILYEFGYDYAETQAEHSGLVHLSSPQEC